jgi:hypothetical protein
MFLYIFFVIDITFCQVMCFFVVESKRFAYNIGTGIGKIGGIA